MTLPPETADLYAVPLADFVRARDELARALKARDPAAAAAIKKLKKLTVPAWAIDRLARTERARLEELFAAGDRLRDAQRAMVRGGDALAVQRAAAEERAIVNALTEACATILEEAGHRASAAYREAIASSLYATTTDADARAAVGSGTLDRDLERVGFGEMPELELVAGGGEGSRDDAASARAAERERAAELRARWKELVHAARAAERDADRAEREADEADEAATRARSRATVARAAADEAAARAERAAEKLKS